MAITFQNQELNFRLHEKTRLKQWITATILNEKKIAGEINFVFMRDQDLLQHNVKFLEHDTLTDIITFDYCEGDRINGDILISVERVAENATKFDVPFETELRRVIIHGVLHLCGYKDKKKDDVARMRSKEDQALRRWK